MLRKMKKQLKRNPFVWRWYLNRAGSYKYLFEKKHLEEIEKEVVDNLFTNGIWKGDANEIFSCDLVEELLAESQMVIDSDAGQQSDKTYARFFLGRVYRPKSIFAQISDHPSIKNIVQTYYQMNTAKLVYYGIWENTPSGEPPKDAQLWHRDRDDLKILKGFIYLTDVGVSNGAFCYAPGTQLDGKVNRKPATMPNMGKVERSTDEQMAQVVPKEKWIDGTAKKGTLVLTDTHGYHKGGYVQEGTRQVFVFMYLSGYSGRMRFENL